jgi:chromosomal replication initiator protein
MEARQLWQAALQRIRLRVSPGAFITWFRDTAGLALDGDELTIGVPNTFASEHLGQRFHELARVAASEVAGRSLRVGFVVRPATTTASSQAAGASKIPSRRPAATNSAASATPPRGRRAGQPEPTHAQPTLLRLPTEGEPARAPAGASGETAGSIQHAAPALTLVPQAGEPRSTGHSAPPAASPSAPSDLQPRYRFETFVVGTANRLAYAAAEEVVCAPGERYNPLLLYGEVGLGKTHLLHAIGHRVRAAGLVMAYVTAERFTNEIIEAIRLRTTDAFRQRYRAVDVLLVDDVQFIAGKESTEEEFFHTFNALHERNKQIVLSSDRVPNAMRHLHDRLRSRFAWGLIADIAAPDFAHRMEILRAKAAAQRASVPEAVLERLARPDCESIRALEGALTRVLAFAEMSRQPLDLALAERAMAPLAGEAPRPAQPVEPARVVAAVARYYGVTAADLCGKSRRPQVAWARQVAMSLLRELTPCSLLQVGAVLGGRDHTTVLHGCIKVGETLSGSGAKRAEVAAIRAELR